MSTRKRRPPLKLCKNTSISDAVDNIKAHLGEPPFSGENTIPTASKVAIVKWIRNCPMTATLFFDKLDIHFSTYRNWIQFVVGSEYRDKKERTNLKLTNEMWLSPATDAIKAHIGEPPYKGQNQIPLSSRMSILKWLHNHPGVNMKELADKIGLHYQTIRKWKKDAAISQEYSASARDQGGNATKNRAKPGTAPEKPVERADRKPQVSADQKRQIEREIIAQFPHQTGAARVPTLHLRNGARITGLSMAQLTELAKGLA